MKKIIEFFIGEDKDSQIFFLCIWFIIILVIIIGVIKAKPTEMMSSDFPTRCYRTPSNLANCKIKKYNITEESINLCVKDKADNNTNFYGIGFESRGCVDEITNKIEKQIFIKE